MLRIFRVSRLYTENVTGGAELSALGAVGRLHSSCGLALQCLASESHLVSELKRTVCRALLYPRTPCCPVPCIVSASCCSVRLSEHREERNDGSTEQAAAAPCQPCAPGSTCGSICTCAGSCHVSSTAQTVGRKMYVWLFFFSPEIVIKVSGERGAAVPGPPR